MISQDFNGWPTNTNVPEPNEEAIARGITKLHLSAALNSRCEARKCIINENIDSDTRDAAGNTALHYAARYNHSGMINWLIKHGANVHIQNNQGQNPLHYAYQAYALRAVKALRRHGALTKVKDINGTVPAAIKRLRKKNDAQISLFAGLEELTKS